MPRKKRPKGMAHVGIERRAFFKEPLKTLSPPARTFYFWLKSRYDGTNNGEIQLPYSHMRGVSGCSSNDTIRAAIDELEEKGWIKITKKGGLYRHNNYYRLTFQHELYAAEK